jgi:hypothetical protein
VRGETKQKSPLCSVADVIPRVLLGMLLIHSMSSGRIRLWKLIDPETSMAEIVTLKENIAKSKA